jgi:predicted amino acid dehydrogenase
MSLLWTPFGFESTTDDVLSGVDPRGERAIVTGATGSLGIETARALAVAGADVTLVARRGSKRSSTGGAVHCTS